MNREVRKGRENVLLLTRSNAWFNLLKPRTILFSCLQLLFSISWWPLIGSEIPSPFVGSSTGKIKTSKSVPNFLMERIYYKDGCLWKYLNRSHIKSSFQWLVKWMHLGKTAHEIIHRCIIQQSYDNVPHYGDCIIFIWNFILMGEKKSSHYIGTVS